MYIISQDKLITINTDNIKSYEIYQPEDEYFMADSKAEEALKSGKYLLVADSAYTLGMFNTCKRASDVCWEILRAIDAGMKTYEVE